jgi:hypothetical protein
MTVQRVKMDFVPRPYQAEAHAKRKRFSVVVWHRRAGKTHFVIIETILEALSTKRPDARYAYIAPFLKQAKANAWDILKHYALAIPGIGINESELSIAFPNGAKIRIYGADNPDALRGMYLDGVVLDEVADMKTSLWGEVIRPLLADRQGWALVIGTPHGQNLFSEMYFKALKDPEWYADLRRWGDTKALPDEEIAAARREMTPNQFAQEFECDFAAAVENALITLESVLAAQQRVATPFTYAYAPKILGVDLARTGGDSVAFVLRQGPTIQKLHAFQPKTLVGEAVLMEVAGQVAKAIDEWQPDAVFLDRGGLGVGVIDRLVQLGYSVIGVDFGGKPSDERFENKRAEMWSEMAKWIQDGGCLPSDAVLAGELTGPTFSYRNARGKFQLESKDSLKARGRPSPDRGDALSLTFAMPVRQKDLAEAIRGSNANSYFRDPDSVIADIYSR